MRKDVWLIAYEGCERRERGSVKRGEGEKEKTRRKQGERNSVIKPYTLHSKDTIVVLGTWCPASLPFNLPEAFDVNHRAMSSTSVSVLQQGLV
jgi:hypothetical protein